MSEPNKCTERKLKEELLNYHFTGRNEASIRCPITKYIFTDPVVCVDGNSYERQAIVQWISKSQYPVTSPLTGETLQSINLIPNRNLRTLIDSLFSESCDVMKEYIRRNRYTIQDMTSDKEIGICMEGVKIGSEANLKRTFLGDSLGSCLSLSPCGTFLTRIATSSISNLSSDMDLSYLAVIKQNCDINNNTRKYGNYMIRGYIALKVVKRITQWGGISFGFCQSYNSDWPLKFKYFIPVSCIFDENGWQRDSTIGIDCLSGFTPSDLRENDRLIVIVDLIGSVFIFVNDTQLVQVIESSLSPRKGKNIFAFVSLTGNVEKIELLTLTDQEIDEYEERCRNARND